MKIAKFQLSRLRPPQTSASSMTSPGKCILPWTVRLVNDEATQLDIWQFGLRTLEKNTDDKMWSLAAKVAGLHSTVRT